MEAIKVLDFSGVKSASDVSPALLDQLHQGFCDIGFVIITNHGLKEKVHAAYEACKEFFGQSVEKKMKYLINEKSNTSGYSYLGRERMSPDIGDMKEYFHMTLCPAQIWPENVPQFQKAMTELYHATFEFGFVVLECMGKALKLDDPLCFKRHLKYATQLEKNRSSFRVHNYPALPRDYVVKPGEMRCGEHEDSCCITLLSADRAGGLQVKLKSGQYIPVPHVDDGLQVNIGTTMQQWTGDKYHAPLHKVLVPDNGLQYQSRFSIPLFITADNDTVIDSGTGKYPPISAEEIYHQCVKKLYFHKEF